MANSGEQVPSRAAEAAAAAAAAATAAFGSGSAAESSAPSSSSLPAAATGGAASSSPATVVAAETPSSPISVSPLATADPVPVADLEAAADEDSEEDEEVADLGSRYWLPSCLTEAYMKQLEEGGFLPSQAECGWRLPGDEFVPDPAEGERVVLTSHLIRGMSLPPSAFFSAILQHYGLQPQNIAPNSILVLAGFQALFEGYLGIVPTVEAFKYCFICRRQNVSAGVMATCGSVTFNCRQGDWYPKIPYIESVKNWSITFFYCKDIPAPGKTIGIPPFVNSPPEHQAHWTEKPAANLLEELRLAFRRIEFLTKTMVPPHLDGVDTVLCWLSRRIMPLRHRPLKMCEYKAEESEGTLDIDVLLFWLRELIQPRFVKAAESVAMFTHDNPAPELKALAEEDLAPHYYNAGAKTKKRKLISTREMEKRKKAAITTEAEDEILGNKVPTKRARPAMPKLRANLKAAAGRSKPVRFSPATALATPATNTSAVLCPGTFMADKVRIAGSAQSAAEKAAGKKVAASTSLRSAEAITCAYDHYYHH